MANHISSQVQQRAKKQARRSEPVSVDRSSRSPTTVMMAVVMTVINARHVDARHVVMAVMVVAPRMIVAAVPVLNLRDRAGRTLLDGSGDARGERGCGLRLRCRGRDNEQSANGEQAEKFSDEHQCSPSGVR
jgi:hypothetical protein